ncbi:MAG: hypothetical protein MUC77_05175 [Chromatiaceae bacterium]|jgi:hypothetical protein|nr:hypothetical protein [Chromatiaceae bacterium]
MQLTPIRIRTCACALAAVLLVANVELAADTRVYRCENAAGGIEFSQWPCAEAGEAISIEDRLTGWTPTAGPPATRVEQAPRRKAGVTRVRSAAKSEAACWNKRQQLEQVNRKLRLGYSPSQGVELRHKRRGYEDYLSELCR